MAFTHFYLTQRQKLETWFVLAARREYFGDEPKTFLSTNWQKKYSLVQRTTKNVFKEV